MDGRVRPDRIAAVLREIKPDVVGLQEVLSVENGSRHDDQARYLAGELEMYSAIGAIRVLRGGVYANVTLSRFPILSMCTHDLSVTGREPRGCVRTDIDMAGRLVLHIFNVHLGTAYRERKHQGRLLAGDEVVCHPEIPGPRIVLGDFNEWMRGLTSELLSARLECPDIKLHLQRTRTYPGFFPFMHLDHIYHDPALRLHRLTLHRSRTALLASDHLPLVADFRV
jgi:endonuclease/exonuclease/phosphatase family metal-dependent hydrolase